ncbi:phosphoribosylanthranilate isomerase [Pseudalkalibacillus berkeleyi]|uniref:N-(5'-phosphoribosyl)anthranilate isomerase n=1 Tax=Pseudalkalibacillus berkeleyi TaxID=1069813 RepID=A0ABS9H0I9_9BACL|nr:phosphoribosylanthranilate isomerase [Pseudalkalibacillus berkeleyi]MCF6137436.1 phosphoribosylanthranilate isomerase [Pseudalkalibacillus berkeleyi]
MTQLKLCGIRSKQDYDLVSQYSEVDYIGFIFAESKRQVKPEIVKQWINEDSPASHVGIFVNPSIEEVLETIDFAPIDIIQLHGNESTSFLHELKSKTNIEIWKALPHTPETIGKMDNYVDTVDGFVIDTKVQGQWGGTGIRFDWDAIPTYVRYSQRMNIKCLIAGGINPSNVEECLSYKPIGIDLSSGIETNENKDREKMNGLIERMNQYEHSIS